MGSMMFKPIRQYLFRLREMPLHAERTRSLVERMNESLDHHLQHSSREAPKAVDELERVTRYQTAWNAYARGWEQGPCHQEGGHLGDEWGTREFEKGIFTRFCSPYLENHAVVLEIGPGGGKYSAMLAPKCRELYCADVAEEMLKRTAERLKEHGHVAFVKVDGFDLHQFEKDFFDFVFSFDVFVHLDIEDIFCYLREIWRVLKPGCVSVIHLASLLSTGGWQKFVAEADLNRAQFKQAGRFGFITPQIAEKFLMELGFEIVAIDTEINRRDFVVVFRKPR
ncbi:MAG: hypothetical protein DME04_23150 [Candidatus Rokuibacteriota bacterium]|nr:MAG: hypothetical protein DME04_23150 [Candidatus Rokubacteria bacterium]